MSSPEDARVDAADKAPRASSEVAVAIVRETPGVAIQVYDRTGRIRIWNPASETLYGFREPETLGRRIQDLLLTVGEIPTFEAEVSRICETGVASAPYVWTVQRKNGERRHVLSSMFPLPSPSSGGEALVCCMDVDVTEQQKAAEALSESRQRLALHVLQSPLAVIEWGLDFTVAEWNPAAERIFGWRRDEALGRHAAGLLVPESAKEHVDSVWRQLIARTGGERSTNENHTKSAGNIICEWYNTALLDREGQVIGVLSLAQDITGRRLAERLQMATYKIAEEAREARDMPALYAAIHAIIGELMVAKDFFVAEYDEASGLLSFPYWVDERDGVPPPQPLGRGLTEYVLRTGRPLLAVPEVFESLVQSGEVDPVGEESVDWLGVPLISRDKAFGVVAIQSYTATNRYGEREKELLTFVSHQIAAAVERKRAEEALRKSEKRFRALVENSSDAVVLLRLDGEIADVTRSMRGILGWEPAEVIGRRGFDYLHPEDRDSIVRGFERVAAATDQRGAVHIAPCRIRHKDGTWRYVEGVATNLLAEPAVSAVVVNFRDITDRKNAEAQIEYQAFHDALTGLPNRRLFRDRLAIALSHAHRAKHTLAVMFLDLDHFKTINDTKGHTPGDVVLREVALRLVASLREGDTVSRFGGDEFALLLPDLSSDRDAARTSAERIARKVLDQVARPIADGPDDELRVTTSIGIALHPGHGDDPEALLKNADRAMYRAKDLGRSTFQFSPEG